MEVFVGADPGFGQGGPQLSRPKVADIVEWNCASEVSYLWVLEAFELFNSQICILPYSRDSFSLIFDI